MIRNNTINGKNVELTFQTLNAISPTNANSLYIDIPELGTDIGSEMQLLYNIRGGETVYMFLTLKSKINAGDFLFSDKPIIQKSHDVRPSGNPIADIVLLNQANDILKSGFESSVQKEFCGLN